MLSVMYWSHTYMLELEYIIVHLPVASCIQYTVLREICVGVYAPWPGRTGVAVIYPATPGGQALKATS